MTNIKIQYVITSLVYFGVATVKCENANRMEIRGTQIRRSAATTLCSLRFRNRLDYVREKSKNFGYDFFFGKSVLRQMVKERAQSNSRPLTGNFHSELNQNVIQHRLFIVIHPYDALRFPIVHIVLLANALGTVPHFHPEWITKSFWLFGENTLWSACTILSQPATNEL